MDVLWNDLIYNKPYLEFQRTEPNHFLRFSLLICLFYLLSMMDLVNHSPIRAAI